MTPVRIAVMQLPHARGLPLPDYQTKMAAGFDLQAAIADGVQLMIAPGSRCLIPTGLAMQLPPHCEAQVRPRSGLAVKHGITVLNAPGTIDADYRGEVQVLLINHGDAPFTVTRGMRIAQMVIATVVRATLDPATALDKTPRAVGGFGSTGQ